MNKALKVLYTEGPCLRLCPSTLICLISWYELHSTHVLDADLQCRCALTCSCMCARPSISSRKRRQTRSMSRYNPASIQLRSVLFSQNSICNNRNNSSLNENLFEVQECIPVGCVPPDRYCKAGDATWVSVQGKSLSGEGVSLSRGVSLTETSPSEQNQRQV